MGVSLGGTTEVRFIYCYHPHDEDQPCTDDCVHSSRCTEAGHDAGVWL